MSALPFTVGRYGRDTHTPEGQSKSGYTPEGHPHDADTLAEGVTHPVHPSKGMAIMATPHDVLCDTGGCPQIEEISKPHGAATEVLLSLGKNPGPATTAMLTQSEISRSSGYTGDGCPDCGNFTMKRNGACLSCETCGGTTGCS